MDAATAPDPVALRRRARARRRVGALVGLVAWRAPRRTAAESEGRPPLAMPAGGVIGLGIFTYDRFYPVNIVVAILAGVTLVAVIARAVVMFRQNTRMLELMRNHAVTDSLTGLGNRRQLVVDIERALAEDANGAPRLLAMFDLDGFKLYNDTFGHPAGDVLLSRLAGRLQAAVEPAATCYRLGGDEFCVLTESRGDDDDGALLDSAATALGEDGEGFVVTSSFGVVHIPGEAASPNDALRVADQRLYAQKRAGNHGSTHDMLLQALFERQPGLRLHVQSVAETASAVGEALGLGKGLLEELKVAARLHDVGKLAIPDTVLQKPGPLDVQEWSFVKEHAVIGERILGTAPVWKQVATIVRATHERWDGAGYPDGLAGQAIPLAARIIAVCDAYSAMTSRRPYRADVSRDEALEELRRCAGSQFDPEVVEAFCRVCVVAGPAALAVDAAA